MFENFYDGKNIQFWDELAKIHFDKSDYNIDSYDPQKYKMNNPAASSGVSKPIVNYRVVRPKGRGI
ncbi:hypothetical protein XBP1_330055 [Xenorhabdus bovienii str. puntauvense]|uniref:Uncharacterized protein n=1 Tax=Xenorhabdus bovienii str. puntauvense TaxID=1398201 RepID=A0A077NJN2_XENBV|nr:hypothetical protein [Xenorhabdus bovienii]CDG98547.1 hypothetical protein XBP1_330055 [Xenorhabdus bovienii str. puntauvense]